MCGSIQSERHVIENCNVTQHLRDRYLFNNLNDICNKFSFEIMCKIIHEVLLSYN